MQARPVTRLERDSLGTVEVPAGAYWGAHTARALANFPISGTPVSQHRELVRALAAVKQAAARANRDLGVLDAERADLLDRACDAVAAGRYDDQLVVDVVQGGAGTSTHMNLNEVVTNVALELAGRPRGDYGYLSPLDHTNRSQSTNDVYPTAVRIALVLASRALLSELEQLADAFAAKSRELADVVKIGRTQLQDAVPMTLGQELGAYATTLREDHERLREAADLLREVNLGGTAIGTGIAAPPGFASTVLAHLRVTSGVEVVGAPDLVESTSDAGAFLTFSGALKRSAVKLSKICNDLRLLSSGPQAGLGEITLPPRQAGSSIMPGKVNPVIPEVVNQIAFVVVGADTTVTMAVEAGQLQLNAFGPVVAHSLLQAVAWLTRGMATLREACVVGIGADAERLARLVARSVGVVTALAPDIGHAAAATIARTALTSGRDVVSLVAEAGLLEPEQLAQRLSPQALTSAAGPNHL